ncbi:hypothetical protein BN1723_007042, partial [Verticillium longisporum]
PRPTYRRIVSSFIRSSAPGRHVWKKPPSWDVLHGQHPFLIDAPRLQSRTSLYSEPRKSPYRPISANNTTKLGLSWPRPLATLRRRLLGGESELELSGLTGPLSLESWPNIRSVTAKCDREPNEHGIIVWVSYIMPRRKKALLREICWFIGKTSTAWDLEVAASAARPSTETEASTIWPALSAAGVAWRQGQT